MNTKKSICKGIMLAILVLMLINNVSAGPAKIDLNPLSQEIAIGLTGTYNITLNSTVAGYLYWDTNETFLAARLDSETFNQTGKIVVQPGTTEHILEVRPLSGITVGNLYDIAIWHTQGGGMIAKASATAGVVPVPEFSTIVLTSAGILGLVLISRRHTK